MTGGCAPAGESIYAALNGSRHLFLLVYWFFCFYRERSVSFVTLPQLEIQNSPTALEAAVGNTPLLALGRLTADLPGDVQILAKAEWFNPGGSVKDRPAREILRRALAEGKLVGGKRLLDSTSGNMGISYATLAAAMQVPVTLTIPANASPERLKILRTLGVDLVLTDPLEGSDGAIRSAQQLAAEQPQRFFYANQYDNPANWQSHYISTGPEIWEQSEGSITHFVAGLGTSGTMMGVGRYLREASPSVSLVAFQPDAPFHGLEGLKHMPTAIQPGIYDPGLVDRIVEVSTEAAHQMVLKLARQEGLFVGISSGAAAFAALQIASELSEGVVVTVFPDAGYKYLSETFWEAVR
jgi:S-sulfo-L-cysteine synthase (O-acetyl-L-serine-dependent)